MRVEPSRLRALGSIGSALALLAGALLLSQAACAIHRPRDPRTVVVYRGDASDRVPGPPPWAPAHGYLHEHRQDVELRYDAGLGVYLVVGRPGHYFRGELFFRRVSGSWTASAGIEGPWWIIAVENVPLGLRRIEAKNNKMRHPRDGGPPPARHD